MVRRLGLFLFIVFFSGSVVIVAARNLRDRLGSFSDQQKEQVSALVEALRGDQLFKAEAKYHQDHKGPPRRFGSYLPEHDLKKIKQFLSGLVAGEDDDAPAEGSK
jgi:hypothetical protein